MLHIGVYLGVSISLMALFFFVAHLLQPDAATVSRRLTEEFAKSPSLKQSPDVSRLYKDTDGMAMTVGADSQEFATGLSYVGRGLSIGDKFNLLLKQADFRIQPAHFLLATQLIGSSFALVCYLLAGWLGALVGWATGTALLFVCLHARRNARREKLLQQLPSAFELLARTLQAGQSVPQAMQVVADAFDDPLATEFANCHQQQHFGLRFEAVFKEMADRSGILELSVFVMAMTIQRQIGGNLSEVLERLAALIRARLKLRQQIRTLTAEGRLQGWTLVILPIIMFGVMFLVNRQYAQVLLDRPGWLAATAASMTVGILWIQNIVRVES